LQCGDDDRLAGFECFLELARRGVDVFDHAEGLFELADRGLELAVEDATIGDHHDGIEDAPVVRAVQGRQLVRKPGNGETLAAPR